MTDYPIAEWITNALHERWLQLSLGVPLAEVERRYAREFNLEGSREDQQKIDRLRELCDG